ncbi:MAG: hypothetical protein AAFV43_04345 [Planctomycetota bacterium]
MLDRPVAEIARFVLGCSRYWAHGLVAPWATANATLRGAGPAPPPYAWLVVMLFAAGVALRVFFAVEATPGMVELSFTEELRRAFGEVSLTHATILTLPCVVLCVAGARLASRLLRGAPPVSRDGVVHGACYTLGWQAGLLAFSFVAPIGMELLGMEPTGRWNRAFNQGLLVVTTLGVLWGGLLLGPAVADRVRGRTTWRVVCGFVGALLVSAPLATASLWVLGQSVDLTEAARVADARQQRAWFGELDIDVLTARSLGRDGRVQLTLAYTSRADRLLVVPRFERLIAAEGDGPFRVIESSLDYLPDRAMLIEPGLTRVAEYTIASDAPAMSPAATDRPGNVAYEVPFHLRETDGGFVQGRAKVYLPRVVMVASESPARLR